MATERNASNGDCWIRKANALPLGGGWWFIALASTALPYRICLVSYQTSAKVWLGYRLLASKAHGKMACQGLDL